MAHHEAYTDGPTPFSVATAVGFSLTLALTLFAAGFALCTIQPTTNLLSRLFSDFETSVYLPQDVVDIAVATRNFTINPPAGGEDAALNELSRVVLAAASSSSSPTSLKAPQWKGVTIPASSTVSSTEMYALAAQGSKYAYGPEEISHLQDCNKLVRHTVPFLVVIAALALVLGVIVRARAGWRPFGRALVAAPAVLLLAMMAAGVWAIVDFPAFFTAFHGFLFPQGNWTFPADSLLITTLPTMFWVAMLFIWITTTVLLSLLCVYVGRRVLGYV